MTPTDWLSELEAKADAATPGPWFSNHCKAGKDTACWCKVIGTVSNPDDERMDLIASAGSIGVLNADYIAAASPSVMKALIAKLRAAEEALETVEQRLIDGETDSVFRAITNALAALRKAPGK